MIIDEKGEFADVLDLTTTLTASVQNADVLDLGAAGVDIFHGQQLYVVVVIDAAFTSAGTPAIYFQLASDATDTIAVDGNQTIHGKSGTFAKGDLTLGRDPICFPATDGGKTPERYLTLQTVASAALTAGSISAFLTLDPHKWEAKADAI